MGSVPTVPVKANALGPYLCELLGVPTEGPRAYRHEFVWRPPTWLRRLRYEGSSRGQRRHVRRVKAERRRG